MGRTFFCCCELLHDQCLPISNLTRALAEPIIVCDAFLCCGIIDDGAFCRGVRVVGIWSHCQPSVPDLRSHTVPGQ
jgi:hypothetical protein